MKITRLNKTLAALGIALFFTFGAFAISLAYESVPIGPLYTGKLQYLLTAGSIVRYAPLHRAGLQVETAYIPELPRPCSEAYHVANFAFIETLSPFNLTRIHTAKVSLQILKSALLL